MKKIQGISLLRRPLLCFPLLVLIVAASSFVLVRDYESTVLIDRVRQIETFYRPVAVISGGQDVYRMTESPESSDRTASESESKVYLEPAIEVLESSGYLRHSDLRRRVSGVLQDYQNIDLDIGFDIGCYIRHFFVQARILGFENVDVPWSSEAITVVNAEIEEVYAGYLDYVSQGKKVYF